MNRTITMFCFTLRLKQEKLQKDNLYLPELYKGRNEAIFMSYYEDISVCKTEAELLALWKTKKATTGHYMEKKQEKTVFINHQNVFISDGIVNETVWNSQDGKKILYVLKEAYGENEDWKLTEWLLQTKPSTSIWKRVIEWTYGIQHTNPERIAKYAPDIYERNLNLFNNIAVVNLKKSSGKSSSNYGEIEAYALADKAEIKKQLSIIAPDIIVCGATFRALNHVYDDKIRPEGTWCDNWFYDTDIISDKKTLVIDYYHPANHYPSLVNYYAITNIYQQALLNSIRIDE